MVESPAALATANRLLSAGFAAQSIGQLYKNSKAFKEAYDRGDQTEALYQATHAVLSGAMTAMAAQHAIVGGTPAAATAAERAVGAKIGETAQAGVTKVGEIASAAKSRLGEAAEASGLVKPAAEDAIVQAIKPSAKAVDNFKDDWQRATPDIQEFDKTSPIKTVEDLHEAIPQIKEQIWRDEVAPAVERHSARPVDMRPVQQAVLDGLSSEMREFEPESADKVENFATRVGKTRSVAEAERLLTYINGKLNSYFAQNPGAKRIDVLTNPDTMMWETARRGIREQFLKSLEAVGEEDVRGARIRYGALTGIENAVENAAGRLAKSPYGSASFLKLGLYKLLGGILGTGVAAFNPVAGGAVGLGVMAADALRMYNANPDVLVRHAIKKGGAIEETEAAAPVGPAEEPEIEVLEPTTTQIKAGESVVPAPSFSEWFKKSKVTNEKGEPLRVYHGTRASKEFSEFETEGRPQTESEEGEYSTSGSGPDPTSYMGAHVAKEPEVANKFATGKGLGADWLRSRYESGQEKPRVIPAYLSLQNPKNFGTERNLRNFINEGKLSGYEGEELLNRAMEADGIDSPHEGGEKVDEWLEKYEKDPEFRVEQNQWLFENYRPEEGEGDFLDSAAQDLARQAKDRLKEMGHDGMTYKNEVEGGTAYTAFESHQVRNAITQGPSLKGIRTREVSPAAAARTTLNASGESAASQEAINRLASERANKITRVRIDTRSGREIPLVGADAVDAKAGPHDKIVQRQTGKPDVVLDRGPQARN